MLGSHEVDFSHIRILDRGSSWRSKRASLAVIYQETMVQYFAGEPFIRKAPDLSDMPRLPVTRIHFCTGFNPLAIQHSAQVMNRTMLYKARNPLPRHVCHGRLR